MLEKISSNWWLFALRGLAAVIFGVLAIVRQEEVLQALVLVFGAFALVNGIITIFTAASASPYFSKWWVMLLEGILSVACGLLAIFQPEITTRALVYVIGFWALFTGISAIVLAIQFKEVLTDEWLLVLGGLLSIAFGVLLFIYPDTGAVSITWTIGIYAIILGVTEIVFAFRLKDLKGNVEKALEEAGFTKPQDGQKLREDNKTA